VKFFGGKEVRGSSCSYAATVINEREQSVRLLVLRRMEERVSE
jgi:hypothetical protein